MIRFVWRHWLRIRLSTLLVAMFTASALVGINLKPFAFYYPRPPWVQELKMFVADPHEDPFGQWGLYGWPAPAFPSWMWCGNGIPEGKFPNWAIFTHPGDAHIACNWAKWNTRALVVDAVANALVFITVLGLWSLAGRALARLSSRKKICLRGNTAAGEYI